jgi:hypothetical protein
MATPTAHAIPCQKVQVKIILWPIVSHPVCLDVRHPSGTCDQFFFLLEIFFRQLWICYFVLCPLWREDWSLIYWCCWTSPAQCRPGSESCGTQDYVLLSQFLRPPPPPGGSVPCIYIPQEQGGPDILPGPSVSFASYDLQGYGGGILSCLHTGKSLPSRSRSHITTDNQSANFSFALKFSFRQLRFVIL